MVFGISLSLSRVVSVTHHLTLTLTHTHTHHTHTHHTHTQHTHTHTHTHTYHTFLHPQHSNPSTQASTINMNVNQKLYSSFEAVNPEYIRLALVLLLGMRQKRLKACLYVKLSSHKHSGFALCVVSLGCGASLGLFDKRAARLTNREEKGSGLYTMQHVLILHVQTLHAVQRQACLKWLTSK